MCPPPHELKEQRKSREIGPHGISFPGYWHPHSFQTESRPPVRRCRSACERKALAYAGNFRWPNSTQQVQHISQSVPGYSSQEMRALFEKCAFIETLSRPLIHFYRREGPLFLTPRIRVHPNFWDTFLRIVRALALFSKLLIVGQN